MSFSNILWFLPLMLPLTVTSCSRSVYLGHGHCLPEGLYRFVEALREWFLTLGLLARHPAHITELPDAWLTERLGHGSEGQHTGQPTPGSQIGGCRESLCPG